jgi:hypothetical protein
MSGYQPARRGQVLPGERWSSLDTDPILLSVIEQAGCATNDLRPTHWREFAKRRLLARSLAILGCAVRRGAQGLDGFGRQIENHRSAQHREITPR